MKKLSLNRETVRMLDTSELAGVNGGNDLTVDPCFTINNTCAPVTRKECVTVSECRTKRC